MAADNTQELILKITGDAASGKAAMDALVKGMSDAGKQATDSAKMIRGMSDAGRQAAEATVKISDAMKQAERSTSSWVGQLNSLAGMFGVTLSAAGLVGLANELLRTGDELVRVADQTGLTTTEVQKLSFIAGQSGNSIDQITTAIGQLQKRLTLGDDGAVKAVSQLGLNLKQLKSASPYEQMALLADALVEVQDPAQLATLQVQLFGKAGAEIIPTMISNFRQLGNEAPVMSDKTVRALDTAGDSLAKFGMQAKVWAAESYNFAGTIFDRITALAYETAASILGAITTFLEIEQKIPGVTTVFNKLGISTESLRQTQQELRDTGKLLVSHLGDQEVAVRKTAKAITDFEPATKKATAAIIGLGDAEKMIQEVLKRQADAFAHYYERLEQIIPAVKEWWNLLANPPSFSLPGIDTLANTPAFDAQNTRTADALKRQLENTIGLMPDLGKRAGDKFEGGFESGFQDIVAGLPSILMRAFEGGGGLGGGLAAIGTSLGASVGQKIGAGIAKSMGGSQTEGEFAKSMFSGGNLAGGIATMGISIGVQAAIHFASKIGKPSKDEVAARDMFSREGYGSVDEFIAAISKKGAELGMNGEALRQSIQKVLDATHISAKAETAALDELKNKMGEAETAAQKIKDALKEPDFDSLQQQAEKFGVTLDALGPKFQQANISKTATEYMATFDALKAAGADVGGVLLGMSDEFSKLVQDSIKFGTTLPANMKPLIQNLIDARKLTNESGDAIDDITSIHFDGTPIDASMTGFQDSIEKASGLLNGPGGVTDAIGAVSKAMAEQLGPIPAPWADWPMPALPAMPDWGGAQAAGGLYHVTRPTLFMAGERPGGESVAFSGIGKKLGGMGGGVTIHVEGSVIRESELFDTVQRAIANRYLQNGAYVS